MIRLLEFLLQPTTHTPQPVRLDGVSYCKVEGAKSRGRYNFAAKYAARDSAVSQIAQRPWCIVSDSYVAEKMSDLKRKLQGQLHLPRRVRAGGLQEPRRLAVVAGEVLVSNGVIEWHEGPRIVVKTIVGNSHALIVTVKKVESFGNEFQPPTLTEVEAARNAEVQCGVVRADKRIAQRSRKTVVAGVVIAIGIAKDARVHRPAAAVGHDVCETPIIEEQAKNFVAAMERARLGNPRQHETVALVRHTGPPLVGGIGVLNRGRPPSHKRVLSIIHGTRPCVGCAEIKSVCHAPPDRCGESVIVAAGRTFENIDRANLRDRALEGIDARRIGAGH